MKMRKTVLIALAISMLLSLTACGGDKAPASTPSAPSAVDAASLSENPGNASVESIQAGSFSTEDIALVISDKTFAINDPIDGVLETLGDNFEYTEAQSCAYADKGMDKTYSYDNDTLFFSTIPPEGKDIIAEVYVRGGDAATSKGIKIGSAREEIEAAYGAGYTFDESQGMLTYLDGEVNDVKTPRLYFLLDGEGKVTEMCIQSGRMAG